MIAEPARGGLWAIVPAAGRGTRFGGDVPKQYLEVGGRSVLAHTLACLAGHPGVAGIVLVLAARDAVDLDGRVEHVAVARVSGPDTLRLDLRITAEDGARATLRFNRDIPR